MNLRKGILVVGVNVAVCLLLVEGFSIVALRALRGEWTSRRAYLAAVAGKTADVDREDGDTDADRDTGAVARLHAPQWMLQPYFGFARNPESKRVTLNGVRIDARVNQHGLFGPSPVTGESDDKFYVALAGGSVALELYLYSREALVAELARLPGAQGRQIEVICLALGGIKQPQQLLQLNYFLVLGAHYDVVLNLDGFNEIALPMTENRPRGVYPFFPRNWIGYSNTAVDPGTAIVFGRLAELHAEQERAVDRLLANPLRRSYAGLVVHELRRRQRAERTYQLEQELRTLMSEESLGPQQRGPAYKVTGKERVLADLVEIWKQSSLQMWALSKGLGTPYFHFLQPNQYVRDSKPFAPWELENAITLQGNHARVAVPGYPLLIAAGRELVDTGAPFFDLTGLYADISRPIYKDNCCHVNQEGGDMMAREIGRRIVSALSGPGA